MLLLVLALSACSPEAPGSAANADRHPAIDALSETLAARGLDPDVLLREAALLGSEQGWDVLRVPAFPAGREPFRILAVASQPRPAPVAGWLHATTTGWATFLDARGAAMTTPDGRPMYVWGPVALPAPSEVRFAVRIQEPALDVWLNRAGADYGVPVTAPQAVTWIGDPWVAQDGLSRMAPGAGLYVGHDTTVYESTWPQSPDVTVLVRWSVDGVDQLPITMAVTAVDDGQFAANTRWEATLPTARLAPGAVVRWKLVGRSVGPDVADDDGGGWYQRTVEPAPEVAWMDQGVYTFSQCHWDGVTCFTGWAWDADLPEPLDATPGQFQAYAAAPLPGVELYVPGVTDAADWDPATSAFLRVEVVSPFFDEDPAGSWLPHPMRWAEAAGPNLRYQWEIRDFHAPTMPATGAMCPADGLYAYRFRVSADGGTTWATLGTADWGAGWGADCTMTWGTFLQAPPVTLQPSGPLDLGAVAVGAQGTAQVTLVNTNNQTLDLTGWSFDDPSGAWTASWVGCPDATACSLRLASGAQKTLRVAFTPAAPGPVTTTLRATRSAPGVCAGDEPFELQVLATSR